MLSTHFTDRFYKNFKIIYGASKITLLRSATQFVACDFSGVNARNYIIIEPRILRAERQSL